MTLKGCGFFLTSGSQAPLSQRERLRQSLVLGKRVKMKGGNSYG